MADKAIWGIHAGASGDAKALFTKGYAGIGWEEAGDLSAIPGTRDAFKQRYAEVYPDAKPQSVATSAGVLFRFVHEMKPGDIVVWRSKTDNIIHIGTVTGGYRYDPALCAPFPNQRAVQWGKAAPITQFSQGALYELGSALSLFQLRN